EREVVAGELGVHAEIERRDISGARLLARARPGHGVAHAAKEIQLVAENAFGDEDIARRRPAGSIGGRVERGSLAGSARLGGERGCATRTAAPSLMESGGLTTRVSAASSPFSTSISVPKSRPWVIDFRCTRCSPARVATSRPLARNRTVLTGMRSVLALPAASVKCTCA